VPESIPAGDRFYSTCLNVLDSEIPSQPLADGAPLRLPNLGGAFLLSFFFPVSLPRTLECAWANERTKKLFKRGVRVGGGFNHRRAMVAAAETQPCASPRISHNLEASAASSPAFFPLFDPFRPGDRAGAMSALVPRNARCAAHKAILIWHRLPIFSDNEVGWWNGGAVVVRTREAASNLQQAALGLVCCANGPFYGRGALVGASLADCFRGRPPERRFGVGRASLHAEKRQRSCARAASVIPRPCSLSKPAPSPSSTYAMVARVLHTPIRRRCFVLANPCGLPGSITILSRWRAKNGRAMGPAVHRVWKLQTNSNKPRWPGSRPLNFFSDGLRPAHTAQASRCLDLGMGFFSSPPPRKRIGNRIKTAIS